MDTNQFLFFCESDLAACTDDTVPPCFGCLSTETIMIEVTPERWHLLCLECSRRFVSDWTPKGSDRG